MSRQRTQHISKQLKQLSFDLADARKQEQLISEEHKLAQRGVSMILDEILKLEKELQDLHT